MSSQLLFQVSQCFVGVLSFVSFVLITKLRRREGYLIGLIQQPVWVYLTFVSGQWGMFIATLLFLFNYAINTKALYFGTQPTAEHMIGQALIKRKTTYRNQSVAWKKRLFI